MVRALRRSLDRTRQGQQPGGHRSQLREPNRYRGLLGAGQAAAQAGKREKARLYFARLLEMAGPGVRGSDMPAVRRYMASN